MIDHNEACKFRIYREGRSPKLNRPSVMEVTEAARSLSLSKGSFPPECPRSANRRRDTNAQSRRKNLKYFKERVSRTERDARFSGVYRGR
jgi:hypothetical protein